jgi:CRISPR-associated protein Csh1
MLQEINNFMNSLPAELKQAGLKPKEGLHVLLKIQEKEGTHFMDELSDPESDRIRLSFFTALC